MPLATAAVFHGPDHSWEFRTLETPSLGTGEVLVAIDLATVCGSDLLTINGTRPEQTPCILGHEAMGRVVAVGPGRDSGWVGQRVTWTLADSCGNCLACRDWDLPQKCDRLFKYGHAPLGEGSGLNGCYATHVVLRGGTTLIPVPDAVTDSMAAPANCALATMWAVTEHLADGGDVAVIQGAGLLGLYGCMLLSSFGWNRVVVVDCRPARLKLVAAFGGEPALNSAANQVRPGSVSAVIEVAGSPEVVAEGIKLLRPGGHYALVGMVHPRSRLDLTGESIIRKCLTLRGTHNYAPRHLQSGIGFLTENVGRFPWSRLVAPPVPLKSLATAVEDAGRGHWPRISLRP